jgi:hypothetical protein
MHPQIGENNYDLLYELLGRLPYIQCTKYGLVVYNAKIQPDCTNTVQYGDGTSTRGC